jgi:hypothetical protein
VRTTACAKRHKMWEFGNWAAYYFIAAEHLSASPYNTI